MSNELNELKIVILQTPDRRLGLNRSRYQHWGVTARLTRELYHEASVAVLVALTGRTWVPVKEAVVNVAVYNGARSMDRDNTISCLKAAFDALQGRVIVNDAGLHIGSVEWRRDSGWRRTVLTVMPVLAH